MKGLSFKVVCVLCKGFGILTYMAECVCIGFLRYVYSTKEPRGRGVEITDGMSSNLQEALDTLRW